MAEQVTSESATPREVVQRYCEAWVRGDAATIVGLYADDIVLHYFGQSPLGGDHVGKTAALAALARISVLTKRGTPEIHDVLSSDSHAAILARESWMDHGTPVVVERVLLYHVRDGKLAECWIYDADQRAVDAILSPSEGG
jgi:ketosteroid isomerase-like protein